MPEKKAGALKAMYGLLCFAVYNAWMWFITTVDGEFDWRDILPFVIIIVVHAAFIVWVPFRWTADVLYQRRHR